MGVPFDDRWHRFDEALRACALLVGTDGTGTGAPRLAPRSLQARGIPLWVASWGSPAGLRRVAGSRGRLDCVGVQRHARAFGQRLEVLRQLPTADGRPLPHALATTWTYVTEVPADAERMLTGTLAPLLNRSVDSLRHLPIGSAEVCAQRLSAFAAAGLERVLLWPLADAVRQLELIRDRVIPLVAASA